MATTARVGDNVHAKLLEIAQEEHRPIGQIIEDAIDQYRKTRFWQGVHADYVRLQADPIAWKEYQDEIALWDIAANDGLEREEPYYTPAEEAALNADDASAKSG